MASGLFFSDIVVQNFSALEAITTFFGWWLSCKQNFKSLVYNFPSNNFELHVNHTPTNEYYKQALLSTCWYISYHLGLNIGRTFLFTCTVQSRCSTYMSVSIDAILRSEQTGSFHISYFCAFGNLESSRSSIGIKCLNIYMPYKGPRFPLSIDSSYSAYNPNCDLIYYLLTKLLNVVNHREIKKTIPCYGNFIKSLIFSDHPSFGIWILLGEYLSQSTFKIHTIGGTSRDDIINFDYIDLCRLISHHNYFNEFIDSYTNEGSVFYRDINVARWNGFHTLSILKSPILEMELESQCVTISIARVLMNACLRVEHFCIKDVFMTPNISSIEHLFTARLLVIRGIVISDGFKSYSSPSDCIKFNPELFSDNWEHYYANLRHDNRNDVANDFDVD